MAERQTCPVCGRLVMLVTVGQAYRYEPVDNEEIARLRRENERLLVTIAWSGAELESDAALAFLGEQYGPDADPVVLMDRICQDYTMRGRRLVEGEKDE